MATNDVWRLSFVGSHLGTELAVCTVHMKALTNVAEIASACSGWSTNLLDSLKLRQVGSFRWDHITCLKIDPLPKESQEYVSGFPKAGTLAGEETGHQLAVVVTEKTQYAGRSYRGRHFVPALPQTAIAGGLWAGANFTPLQGYYDTMVALYGASGSSSDWRWVVWSEKLHLATPVTSTIVRNNPGVIRRRRIGVGQ